MFNDQFERIATEPNHTLMHTYLFFNLLAAVSLLLSAAPEAQTSDGLASLAPETYAALLTQREVLNSEVATLAAQSSALLAQLPRVYFEFCRRIHERTRHYRFMAL